MYIRLADSQILRGSAADFPREKMIPKNYKLSQHPTQLFNTIHVNIIKYYKASLPESSDTP
jgi:hypothetical protein